MGSFLAGLAAGAALGLAAGALVLRARLRRLGRFFSFAAHEINTPITAVNMTILNFISGVFGEVSPAQAPWIEMMREQVGRLNGMVGELRDMIHLELHKDLRLHLEDVPALELVDGARRAIAHGCATGNVPLEVDAAPDAGMVRCDPDRAPRTLASMLFHARKFRSSGPLRLSARADGEIVRFAVEFETPRLSANEAELSLDLYFPAIARQDQRMSATGVGLGILREVARLQGGEVRLSAHDGKATLTLELPRASRNSVETRGS